MNLRYRTRKLEKTVDSFSSIKKNYGTRAKQVYQRIDDLEMAACLADMFTIQSAHCHELTGERSGEFAVSISRNHRIIFLPDHDPVPCKEDGGIDITLVESIVIIAIGEDYH
ncbi:MAG TPA: killer suppression protein HigA [Prosthecochloris aestuarii]|uniref:Killer suppression protein HigA n=1 Tax=Prosthecochloris aestuarii TaxID=1102 RepID=A0A831SNI7_PROAE|nr:killer suppression protein HigA [Prosthecochloris aestuarii]